jgi:hypothetical protein
LTNIHQLIRILDEGVWAGYGGKTPEINGTWKQYSRPEVSGLSVRNTAFMFH